MRNNDRTSKPVMNQIVDGLGTLPRHARHSFTFDRGTEPKVRTSEFAAWRGLNDGLGSQTRFCDPQSLWQKGSVENANGRARRFPPRSSDPPSITPALLAVVIMRMNRRTAKRTTRRESASATERPPKRSVPPSAKGKPTMGRNSPPSHFSQNPSGSRMMAGTQRHLSCRYICIDPCHGLPKASGELVGFGDRILLAHRP